MLITFWDVHSLASMVVHKWGWAASWDDFKAPLLLKPMLPIVGFVYWSVQCSRIWRMLDLMLDDLTLKGGPATSEMCGPGPQFSQL